MLTKSAITREDYARDPQAVLDVLEFYTDDQKREMEEMGFGATLGPRSVSTTGSVSTLVGSTYSGSDQHDLVASSKLDELKFLQYGLPLSSSTLSK